MQVSFSFLFHSIDFQVAFSDETTNLFFLSIRQPLTLEFRIFIPPNFNSFSSPLFVGLNEPRKLLRQPPAARGKYQPTFLFDIFLCVGIASVFSYYVGMEPWKDKLEE